MGQVKNKNCLKGTVICLGDVRGEALGAVGSHGSAFCPPHVNIDGWAGLLGWRK